MVPWVVGHILHGGYIELFLVTQRARRSAMMPWVVGHILHGGYIELFLITQRARRSAMGRRTHSSWWIH